MLDLTKPVRFTMCRNAVRSIYPSSLPGRYLVEHEDDEGVLHVCRVFANELENIPEPKVATAVFSVWYGRTGDAHICVAENGDTGPMVKLTYTEGAENPWQIEEVK